jgi:hypothetical protein
MSLHVILAQLEHVCCMPSVSILHGHDCLQASLRRHGPFSVRPTTTPGSGERYEGGEGCQAQRNGTSRELRTCE